jgi:hypothetical protein
MKKLFHLMGFVLIALSVGAWSVRPAFNRITSKYVTAGSGSSNIPTAYSTSLANSLVMTGLSGNGYSHIMVLNNTTAMISLLSTESSSSAPSSSTNQKMYVSASGTGAWDDVSVFDAVYLQSESGSSLTSGTVQIMVW